MKSEYKTALDTMTDSLNEVVLSGNLSASEALRLSQLAYSFLIWHQVHNNNVA